MTSPLVRIAAAPIVAGVLVLGIWVAGGQITNDFTVAMWLTVAWMLLAGLICLRIAIGRRSLALPVLAAYLLTAVLAGAYLGRSMFFDDRVDEDVATASPRPPRSEQRGPLAARRAPVNVQLARGPFESLAHSARGTATAIDLASGGRVLTLTNFEVDNGPDLRVYLVAGPARTESDVEDLRDLGALKGNKGDQQYEIPHGLRLDRYGTVVIWCRAFSVAFARAPLRGA